MFKSLVLAIIACLFVLSAQGYDNVCTKPTILTLQESSSASLQLISNGDIIVFPDSSTNERMTFVKQRLGAVTFNTQLRFGEGSTCTGTVAYSQSLQTVVAYLVDGLGNTVVYDLVNNAVIPNFVLKKRDVPIDFYSISSVNTGKEPSFALRGANNYFFSGNQVISCLDSLCLNTVIVSVQGKIVSARETTEALLVLSVENGNLILTTIEGNAITSTINIYVSGKATNEWSFLSESEFVGITKDSSFTLVTVTLDGAVNVIAETEEAQIKVAQRNEFNFVTLSTSAQFVNYVCRNNECRKVSLANIEHGTWDADISTRETTTVLAFQDEITVISCTRFDCGDAVTSVIKTPGIVTSVKVAGGVNPVVVYSLENGASGIATCIDSKCHKVSLTRANDYLSSPNVSFIRTETELILFADGKIQSFSNKFASPSSLLCHAELAGKKILENGEVFICNALPSVENYAEVFFWTPVVTSVFTQNI